MADEISIRCSIAVDNNAFQLPEIGRGVLHRDQTNPQGGGPGIVIANTTGVDIDFGDNLTTNKLGWMRLENVNESVSTVQWGVKVGGTFYPVGQLTVGDVALLKLTTANTGTYHLKALAGTIKVSVVVVDT